MPSILPALLALGSALCAQGAYSYDGWESCSYPELCKAPATKYSKVLPVKGRFQWDESGGFCGSLSIQTMALTHGAWISQDFVRKANRGGLCFGHTDVGGGCEIGPENYGLTASNLKFDFEVWDFTKPRPQAKEFKRWIKSHLVKGHPVMFAPMLKKAKHTPYGRVSVPGDGHFDHHEPIIGIGSNHDLSDPEVYDDDWLVHYSDYDLQPCHRNFSTLEDDQDLQGNCKNVREGKNVMHPCFYKEVVYGLALKGLAMFGAATRPRVHLEMDRPDEPRVRVGHPQVAMHGTVTVKNLEAGKPYVLYRFNSTQALPDGVVIDLLDMTYERRYPFVAEGDTWNFEDPLPIMSDSATYYVVIEAGPNRMRIADSLKHRVPRSFLNHEPAWNPTDRAVDVRPRGVPELAALGAFKSLAEHPAMPQGWASGAGVAVGALAAITITVGAMLKKSRSPVAMGRPALG